MMGKALSGELSCPCDRSCFYSCLPPHFMMVVGRGVGVQLFKVKNLLPLKYFPLRVDLLISEWLFPSRKQKQRLKPK